MNPGVLLVRTAQRHSPGLALILAVWLMLGPTAAASADASGRVAPLPGPVLRGFQIAEYNWLPGHRGVDLAGTAGDLVTAAAAGTISWVGVIDGVPMMTVQHPDGLRTTYQPVEASVAESFCATKPGLPRPVTTTRPRQARARPPRRSAWAMR